MLRKEPEKRCRGKMAQKHHSGTGDLHHHARHASCLDKFRAGPRCSSWRSISLSPASKTRSPVAAVAASAENVGTWRWLQLRGKLHAQKHATCVTCLPVCALLVPLWQHCGSRDGRLQNPRSLPSCLWRFNPLPVVAMGLGWGLSSLMALLAAGALLATCSSSLFKADQWCFYNPDSINGPFITAWHWSLGGQGIAYITTSEIREPGWQCSTIALAVQDSFTFQGPATCRSLIPITVHHYWNNVTIRADQAQAQADLGTNCSSSPSSCVYSDVPIGGPWPQTSCAKLPPHIHGSGLLGRFQIYV